MSRWRVVAIASVAAPLAALGTVSVTGLAQASPRPAETILAGSAAPFPGHVAAIRDVPAAQQLTIQVWLKPSVAAAQRFAAAASTPGTATFRHYLSPAAYTARFGPSRGEASAVESWLRAAHFTGAQADAQRDYVRATAPAAVIDAAFRTTLKLYKAPAVASAGPYTLRANSRPLTLPSALAASVLGVTGLDNAGPLHPAPAASPRPVTRVSTKTPKVPCSGYYGQQMLSGLPAWFGVTSFPTGVCGYSASQIRAAYGASGTSSGAGQTIALVEDGLTKDMFLTLQDYSKANSLPAPSQQRYREDALGTDTACGDPSNEQEQADVEGAYAMAPGASEVVVGGDACDNGDYGVQAYADADIAILNGSGGHPLATIACNSWDSGTDTQPFSLTRIEHAYLVRAAAEGVGMYFTSGTGIDNSPASGPEMPASDPYATAVGATTLGLGKNGSRLFETGMSDGLYTKEGSAWGNLGLNAASGGGPSLLWNEPAYQHGVVPSAMATIPGSPTGPVRSVPDISADGDFMTGPAVGLLAFKGTQPPRYTEPNPNVFVNYDTPLVAGMVAAAQQGQARPFGFLNPVLYRLAGSSAFRDVLPLTSASPALDRDALGPSSDFIGGLALLTFDDQTGLAGYLGQVTAKGYDNMTGLGTPNGQAFISALRKARG